MSQQRGAITLHRNGTIALRILAKPGAKSTAITDVGEDGIGVAIGAPPREGEANEELVSFIGKILDLKKSEIALDKGGKSRLKTLLITSSRVSYEEVVTKLRKEAKA